jgi:hypothetical protein
MAVILVAACLGQTLAKEDAPPPKIQLALLLDDSGSMGGLINQAKNQLWTFVNELALSKRDGAAPIIEVALYRHGGPVQQVSALTDDLDLLSERLFAVTIQGNGSEHCGEVIKAATDALAWSDSPEDLKVIFVAGNEAFTQGPVDYKAACKAAIAKGIVINTIHCGSGIPEDWNNGAVLADGMAMAIDQNKLVPHIDAPQDTRIVELGEALNKTYIAYGASGASGVHRQQEQNANAQAASKTANVNRYVAQAQTQYRNSAWDLVDAVEQGQVKLEEIEEKDLPEAMQKMDKKGRLAFVEENAGKRTELQTEINTLNAERRKFVAAEMKKLAGDGNSLDIAMVKTLRNQAEKLNFAFAEE